MLTHRQTDPVRIVLTQHGQQRAWERGIDMRDIQNVVSQPMIKVQRADGCVEYVGESSGRRLKIVLDEAEDPARLVTAFWQ